VRFSVDRVLTQAVAVQLYRPVWREIFECDVVTYIMVFPLLGGAYLGHPVRPVDCDFIIVACLRLRHPSAKWRLVLIIVSVDTSRDAVPVFTYDVLQFDVLLTLFSMEGAVETAIQRAFDMCCASRLATDSLENGVFMDVVSTRLELMSTGLITSKRHPILRCQFLLVLPFSVGRHHVVVLVH